jgi:hypothetical protein
MNLTEVLTLVSSVLVTVVIPAIAFAAKAYRDFKKGELSIQDDLRLANLAQQAVAACEELADVKDWDSEKKLKYVKDTILSNYPNLDEGTLDLAINAAIFTIDVGKSALEKRSAK